MLVNESAHPMPAKWSAYYGVDLRSKYKPGFTGQSISEHFVDFTLDKINNYYYQRLLNRIMLIYRGFYPEYSRHWDITIKDASQIVFLWKWIGR